MWDLMSSFSRIIINVLLMAAFNSVNMRLFFLRFGLLLILPLLMKHRPPPPHPPSNPSQPASHLPHLWVGLLWHGKHNSQQRLLTLSSCDWRPFNPLQEVMWWSERCHGLRPHALTQTHTSNIQANRSPYARDTLRLTASATNHVYVRLVCIRDSH